MNIQEAIKAIDDGKIVQCLANDFFFKKTHDEYHEGFYDISKTVDFIEILYCNSCFTREEVESEWRAVNEAV